MFTLNNEIGVDEVRAPARSLNLETTFPLIQAESAELGLNETLARIERRLIVLALEEHNGNQGRAAATLKIPRTTLRDRMARHKIPL